jgi:hypothetical protein
MHRFIEEGRKEWEKARKQEENWTIRIQWKREYWVFWIKAINSKLVDEICQRSQNPKYKMLRVYCGEHCSFAVEKLLTVKICW